MERTSRSRRCASLLGGKRPLPWHLPVGFVSVLSGPPIASRRFEAQHTLLYDVPNMNADPTISNLQEGIRCRDESAMRIREACKAYAPPGPHFVEKYP